MKKINLAFLTLFFVGFFSLFSINISAQNSVSTTTEKSAKTCSGEKFVMPASLNTNTDAFVDYIKIVSLPLDGRHALFAKLSNEQKSSILKVNYALQFVKRPNMTKVQQEFVLDAISKISPDLWDKSDAEKIRRSQAFGVEVESKAFGLFGFKEAGDFVEPLNTNKEKDLILLQKYEDLLKFGMKKRAELLKDMSVNERVDIWKTQFAYHLATTSLNTVQRSFITKMIAKVQEILEVSPTLSNDAKKEYFQTLESEILKNFTKPEAFAIFMEIGIHKYVKDGSGETTDLLPSTCNCNLVLFT